MTSIQSSSPTSPVVGERRGSAWSHAIALVTSRAGTEQDPARAPEARWNVPFIAILAQVIVLALLARVLRIENVAFHDRLMPYIVAGFVLHHSLPSRHRLWAFAALSIGSLPLIFGLVGGLWLLAAGLTLIALCHLPIRIHA